MELDVLCQHLVQCHVPMLSDNEERRGGACSFTRTKLKLHIVGVDMRGAKMLSSEGKSELRKALR